LKIKQVIEPVKAPAQGSIIQPWLNRFWTSGKLIILYRKIFNNISYFYFIISWLNYTFGLLSYFEISLWSRKFFCVILVQ
jgi:hypothetical protein